MSGPVGQQTAALDATRRANQVRHVVHRWLSCQEPDTDTARDVHLREVLAPGAKIYRAFDGTSALDLRHLYVEDHGAGDLTAHITIRTGRRSPRLVRAEIDVAMRDDLWFPGVRRVRNAGSTRDRAAPVRARNRVAATVYAWLGVIDGGGAHVERARELVTGDIAVTRAGRPAVSGADGVVAWLAGQRERLSHSAHHVEDLDVCATDAGWTLSLLVRVEAVATAGEPMVLLTRHRWQLRETHDRYVRIAAMDIDLDHGAPVTSEVVVPAKSAVSHEVSRPSLSARGRERASAAAPGSLDRRARSYR